jgi:hypothetical protein
LTTNRGDASNAYSYLSAKQVRKVENKYLFDQSIFTVEKLNFRIDRNDIQSIVYNPLKVDLGNYINNGTIELKSLRHDTKELIVLGNQNGNDIVKWIQTR